jgi:hypothetical protein
VETNDPDIEKLLETTDWEPQPDPVREQVSLARLVSRLDLRRHRMHILARTSCAFAIVMLVIVTGTTWSRWARPMAIAVEDTQSLPQSAARLIEQAST